MIELIDHYAKAVQPSGTDRLMEPKDSLIT